MTQIITLDGPSGCGKGTISQMLANHLGYHLLDSGALYRIVAFQADKLGYRLDDSAALVQVAQNVDIRFEPSSGAEPAHIWVAGADVTDQVRSDKVAAMASKIAKDQQVRDALMPLQHSFAQAPGLVADGRDMGTVVFPQAKPKFYLDASTKVRAQRRYSQLKQKGFCVSLPRIETEIAQRDHNDRSRKCSPLMPAQDAIQIDTSNLDIQQVFAVILEHLN